MPITGHVTGDVSAAPDGLLPDAAGTQWGLPGRRAPSATAAVTVRVMRTKAGPLRPDAGRGE